MTTSHNKSSINILYANESFAPQYDGVAICAQNYADIINRKYGKSYMLVPAHKDRREEDFGFELLQCPSSKLTIVNQYKVCLPMPYKMKNKIEEIPLDLTHSHCPFVTGIISMRLAKEKDIPHVATFHSKYKDDVNLRLKMNADLPGEMVAKYVAAYYEKCDYVWTVNHGTAKTLEEYGYKGDITIMPNGCDMPVTYRDDSVRQKVARRYGADAQSPILLFVGRITYLKNVDLIVKALGAIKRRGKNFTMLMVGSGEDEERLKKLIEELGLKNNVKLTGKVMDREELRDIYSSADLFVFPSVYDNAPLVVREAAACGVASLLIKGSNSAEGITDGENGVLSEEKVEDIALAIGDAISDMDLRKLGENARDSIYISWEDVIEKAVNEYERILTNYQKKAKTKSRRIEKIYDIDLLRDFNIKKIQLREKELYASIKRG